MISKLNLILTRFKRPRRISRLGLIFGNVLLLAAVGAFIIYNRSASQTVRTNTLQSAVSAASAASNPLDQLSSAQIALNVAQMTKLPELTPIRNQADSDSLLLTMVPNDTTVLAKPQVVATAARSKNDIVTYTTKEGDTVSKLAAEFGVNAESIRWSNSIGGDNLTAGITIYIPPVNGIVYKVKEGDTPASLARRYAANERQIIAVNDAEISGLNVGELILIPSGRIQPAVPSFRSISSSFFATYGGNGYDYGYCTWYVAKKVAIPTNWGNANTWDNYARLSGWIVSSQPRVGAVAQTDSMSYLGHVGYVEAVSEDGTMIKYSDMNGLAGWGRVGYSGWMPATTFPRYIYR